MSEHNDPGQQGWPGGQPQQPQYPGQASAPGWSSHPPTGQPLGQASYPPATGPGGAQAHASGSFTARPRTRLAFLIGAFAGVVLGGGGVALGWSATTAGPFPSTAGQPDATAACAALARTTNFDPINDLPGYLRWGAASAMASAAAEADPQYKSLDEAIRRPLDFYQQTFTAEGPEFADALSKARQACND